MVMKSVAQKPRRIAAKITFACSMALDDEFCTALQ
jgi:hypothetical protein